MILDPVDNYRIECDPHEPEGGDISGCDRVSLVPAVPLLPQHDFLKMPFVRRFARRFQKATIGSNEIGRLQWRSGSSVVGTPTDMTGTVKPGDMIRVQKIDDPYPWSVVQSVHPDHLVMATAWEEEKGRDAVWMTVKFIPPIPPEHYHCIVCKGFRIWVRSATGGVLTTPEDFELYV